MKKPSMPAEDPNVDVMRKRQIEELAALDEEENRRLKSAFVAQRGIRAFRQSGGSSGSTSGRSAGGPQISPGRMFRPSGMRGIRF